MLCWLFKAFTACQHCLGSCCWWEMCSFYPNSWQCFPQRRQEHHGSFLLAAQPTMGMWTPCVCPKEMVKEGRSQKSWCISRRSEQTYSKILAPEQGRRTSAEPCSGEGLLFAISPCLSRAWRRPLSSQTSLPRGVSPSHMWGMCFLKRKTRSNWQMLEEC